MLPERALPEPVAAEDRGGSAQGLVGGQKERQQRRRPRKVLGSEAGVG
jgi:hypothetical protein